MDNRKKIIILIVVGLIVIAGIVFGVIMLSKKTKPIDKENAPIQKVVIPKEDVVKVVTPPPTETEKTASAVKNVALAFVERFGTFTNESNYKSFDDLYPVLTASTATWMRDTYVPGLIKEHDPRGFFYRIVTDARTAEITEQKDNAVKLKISTQRTETKGDAPGQSFIQDIILDMVKENNNWLINGVVWQKK